MCRISGPAPLGFLSVFVAGVAEFLGLSACSYQAHSNKNRLLAANVKALRLASPVSLSHTTNDSHKMSHLTLSTH